MSQRPNLVCASAGLFLLIAAIGVLSHGAQMAQAADEPAKPAKELPKPEDVALTTQDKIAINAVYYASNLGKKAVPIILLHGYKGSHADFTALATLLQKEGHAVIVPDLRGHGKSAKITGELKKNDFVAMINDVEAVNNFLMKKNNEGELNIEKLCIVGSEMGATLAIKYAAYDWHWPQLIGVKQGRDVKAVVMITPEIDFKGINMKDEISNKDLQANLSMFVLFGEQNSKSATEAKKINTQLERLHVDPPAEERADKKDYYYKGLDTNLQGVKLLGANLGVEDYLVQFIERRLVKKPFPWTDRTSKL